MATEGPQCYMNVPSKRQTVPEALATNNVQLTRDTLNQLLSKLEGQERHWKAVCNLLKKMQLIAPRFDIPKASESHSNIYRRQRYVFRER